MTGASLAAPQATEQVKYQFRDDFSWLVGGRGGLGHAFKAGVNFINEPRLFIDAAAAKGVTRYTLSGNRPERTGHEVSTIDGAGGGQYSDQAVRLLHSGRLARQRSADLNAGVRYDLVTGLNFDQSKNPNFVNSPGSGAGRKAGLDRRSRELRSRFPKRPQQHPAAHRWGLRS